MAVVIVCGDCGDHFPKPNTPGRPPKYCAECRRKRQIVSKRRGRQRKADPIGALAQFLDDLLDDLELHAAALSDTQRTRLTGMLTADLSGRPPAASGNPTSSEVAKLDTTEPDRCVRCGSADGWPLCPTCAAKDTGGNAAPAAEVFPEGTKPPSPHFEVFRPPRRVQKTEQSRALQSGHESRPQIPVPVPQTRRSEPPSTQTAPSSAHNPGPESALQSGPASAADIRAWARANGHDAAERGRIPQLTLRAWRAAHPAAPLSASELAPARAEPRRTSDRDVRTSDRDDAGVDFGLEVEDIDRNDEPTPAPTSAPPGRRCAGGCGALLSRYNPDDTCARCQQASTRSRIDQVRVALTPGDDDDPSLGGVASRLSNIRAPRLKGEVVLSDGTISELDCTESPRDAQGRVICRTCGHYMSSSLGCGCDPGELDDDDVPLDRRWRDGEFRPELADSA